MAGVYHTDGNTTLNVDYYLQDELGSPIRLLDEDGILHESYGYDEFGADLYGNQGQIQPFGYTGYQHDSVVGTYFAQAREYATEVGRFVERDVFAGSIIVPFTLNQYNYCFNSPMILVDLNGAWPEWIQNAGEWIDENKEDIAKVAGTTAMIIGASALTVATLGTGAGVALAAFAGAGALVGAEYNVRNGENAADGFMRGGLNAMIITGSFVVNPMGGTLGIGCQVATDIVVGEISGPEIYAGAAMGGVIGTYTNNAALGAAAATGIGATLKKISLNDDMSWGRIALDTAITGGLGFVANKVIQTILPFDLEYYINKQLSQGALNWLETIMAGTENGLYSEVVDCIEGE